MAEQVNPGFDPPRRGSLGDPARMIGNNDRAAQAMAARLQSLERLLHPYREKQVQVRNDDGTFQKIWVLAKEGGGDAGGSYGSTLVPKLIYQKDGVWRLVFWPARFIEHSLTQAGKDHKIKCPGGFLTDDPLPEIPLKGETEKVYLKFVVTRECEVKGDSPEITTGEEPTREPMQPKRPDIPGADGSYVQHVGTVKFTDDVPEWVPNNSDASVSIFLPIIETVGDGIRDYDDWLKPNVDKWRTFRAETDEEMEEKRKESGEQKLEDEFDSDSGFEIRKFPLSIKVALKDNTLVWSGTVKVPIPKGDPGSRTWTDCEGNEVMKINWNKGLVRSTGDESMEAGCDGNDGNQNGS